MADFLKDKRENDLKCLIQTDEALTDTQKKAENLKQEKIQIKHKWKKSRR